MLTHNSSSSAVQQPSVPTAQVVQSSQIVEVVLMNAISVYPRLAVFDYTVFMPTISDLILAHKAVRDFLRELQKKVVAGLIERRQRGLRAYPTGNFHLYFVQEHKGFYQAHILFMINADSYQCLTRWKMTFDYMQKQIVTTWMECRELDWLLAESQIRFAEQPFLVYHAESSGYPLALQRLLKLAGNFVSAPRKQLGYWKYY